MFKTLVGRGHPEFSTKRQQDAQEYYLHLLNLLEVHLETNYNTISVLEYPLIVIVSFKIWPENIAYPKTETQRL